MKPEWGKKICCLSCGNIFYDMRKLDVVCPKCGTKFKSNVQKKTGKGSRNYRKVVNSENDGFGLSEDYGTLDDVSSIENGNLVMESD